MVEGAAAVVTAIASGFRPLEAVTKYCRGKLPGSSMILVLNTVPVDLATESDRRQEESKLGLQNSRQRRLATAKVDITLLSTTTGIQRWM
jgi:hypothetical protein